MLSSIFLSSQSLIKTKYSNKGSRGFDFGISKNTENVDNILSFRSHTRYRIFNTGFEVSSAMGDSLLKIRHTYISVKAGLGIPVFHKKYFTTTLNVNGTYNIFDKLSNDKVNGAFGYEAFIKFNSAYVNCDIGYSGNPNSDKPTLNRTGPFVRVGFGLNRFFSKKEGWSTKNLNKNPNEINLKRGDKLQGTGFALAEDGYIVTCYHVVKDSRKVKVIGVNGTKKKEYEAEVIVSDEDADIAILKIKENIENIPFKFKTKESISGKKIYTLGYPKSQILGSDVKITEGIINATSGFGEDQTVYQISASITGGNSGGPLFDDYGNVIGITSSGYRDESSDLINYAIKIAQILPLLEKIPNSDSLISEYDKTPIDGSKIANEYGNFVYIIIAEH